MNLQDNIKRMEQELADMKKQLEQQSRLELKGGDGFVLQTYSLSNRTETTIYAKAYTERGAFRATKELAEIADKNMVTRNRLEAHVHEIQNNGEGAFVIKTGEKQTKHYYYDLTGQTKPIGSVCMLRKTAEILCEALNKGEIEL